MRMLHDSMPSEALGRRVAVRGFHRDACEQALGEVEGICEAAHPVITANRHQYYTCKCIFSVTRDTFTALKTICEASWYLNIMAHISYMWTRTGVGHLWALAALLSITKECPCYERVPLLRGISSCRMGMLETRSVRYRKPGTC